MNLKAKQIPAALLAAVIFLFAYLLLALPASAEPAASGDDDIHDLLEKSLSVVEIDKEIARIQEQRERLILEMDDAERELELQKQAISDKQEAAGSILRAYYMGDRDFLFAALLSFDSISELFRMMDYTEIILTKDKHTLNTYLEQYQKTEEVYNELETRNEELAAVERQLQLQKTRVLALERQLDEQLAGRNDADRLRLLMNELTAYWESAGVSEVKLYFRALSKAMKQLPDWVQDNKQLLDIKGFNYTITVPENELNAFLREQNDLFKHFSFAFKDGKVTAQGIRNHMEIRVSGHYTIENKPKNSILFHVDELLFNGFALPDTTRSDLEKEFDLGFYPNLIVSFLEADSVDMKDGELTIRLSLKL